MTMVITVEADLIRLPQQYTWASVPGQSGVLYTYISNIRVAYEEHAALRARGLNSHLGWT